MCYRILRKINFFYWAYIIKNWIGSIKWHKYCNGWFVNFSWFVFFYFNFNFFLILDKILYFKSFDIRKSPNRPSGFFLIDLNYLKRWFSKCLLILNDTTFYFYTFANLTIRFIILASKKLPKSCPFPRSPLDSVVILTMAPNSFNVCFWFERITFIPIQIFIKKIWMGINVTKPSKKFFEKN